MLVDAFKRSVFHALNYTPFPQQDECHFSPYRHRALFCGRRWGKSKGVGTHEATVTAMMPNQYIWCVAPTYDLANKVFRPTYNNLIRRLRLPVVRESLSQQYIEFPWGTIIEGKSADNPTSLLGEGLTLVIADELAKYPEMVWKECLRPTLMDTGGRFLGITTPSGPGFTKDLYNYGQDDENDQWWSLRSPSWENPWLEASEIDETVAELGGPDSPYVRQEIGAEFVVFAGLVYFMFIRDKHYIEPPPFPSSQSSTSASTGDTAPQPSCPCYLAAA